MYRLLVLSILATAPVASAESRALEPSPESIVERKLLVPLAASEVERSRFSRAIIPPSERRARVQQGPRQTDRSGAVFVNFSVDERRGYRRPGKTAAEEWRQDVIAGCVYPASGEVFVLKDGSYLPADRLVGKRGSSVPEGACQVPSRV